MIEMQSTTRVKNASRPQLKSAKREKWVRWLHLQTVSSELLSGGST